MNKKLYVSLLWKIILVGFCVYGLLDGSGLLRLSYEKNFPHMFTNISNMFALIYFICAIVYIFVKKDNKVFVPFLKYTAIVSLTVTMLIGHFMLQDALFQDGKLVFHLVILHYIVPIMSLLDWLMFDEKGKMPIWGPVSWLSLVLGYLVVVMINVNIFGIYMGGGITYDITNYPYTFLDPGISGVKGVLIFVGSMFIAFLVLGYILVFIDRILSRKQK